VLRPGGSSSHLHNLFDFAARVLYYRHFDRPELYLNSRCRLSSADRSSKTKQHRQLFEFAVRNRFKRRILFSCLKAGWAAPDADFPSEDGACS